MDKSTYTIIKLNNSHNKTSFCCDIPPLDRYLHEQAKQDIKRNIAAVYVLTQIDSNEIIGYYTLSAISIELKKLPEKETKKLPRYPSLPATLIGRLAVDKKFQHQGIGELLLIHALKTSFENNAIIASMAVTVDAKDNNAVQFYKHFGFIPLSESSDKLFLPMDSIKTMNLI